jgi:hypothetical protein
MVTALRDARRLLRACRLETRVGVSRPARCEQLDTITIARSTLDNHRKFPHVKGADDALTQLTGIVRAVLPRAEAE